MCLLSAPRKGVEQEKEGTRIPGLAPERERIWMIACCMLEIDLTSPCAWRVRVQR